MKHFDAPACGLPFGPLDGLLEAGDGHRSQPQPCDRLATVHRRLFEQMPGLEANRGPRAGARRLRLDGGETHLEQCLAGGPVTAFGPVQLDLPGAGLGAESFAPAGFAVASAHSA